MEFIKKHLSTLLVCAFEIIIGILLLINPLGFTQGIFIAIGILALVLGIRSIIRYFKAAPEDAAHTADLFIGLTAIAFGCFCTIRQNWIIAAFPVLAVFYGVAQILGGFQKIQLTVDALRLKSNMWYFFAISAALSLLLGAIIIGNPAMAIMSVWVFTGISLIVEGIFDAVTMWFTTDHLTK